MTSKEKIKKEIEECINSSVPILLYLQGKEDINLNKDFSFHLSYQKWYSQVLKILEYLGKDRLQDFKNYYEVDPKRKSLTYGTYVIQDYLKGIVPSYYSDFNSMKETLNNFYNQYTILTSIYERMDSVLSDIQSTLFIELQDLELDTARSLIKVNLRSSGVIAGVILETHLNKVSGNHAIKIPKKSPTISDYNEALKNNGIYDIITWRKVTYLGDIRNICAHKKEKEPTKEQIEELIDGVHWVIKTIS